MCNVGCFFFIKQKTAYELRISDWSSDVCSSDLQRGAASSPREHRPRPGDGDRPGGIDQRHRCVHVVLLVAPAQRDQAVEALHRPERKSVVSGKSVSVRLALGCRRILKKKTQIKTESYLCTVNNISPVLIN